EQERLLHRGSSEWKRSDSADGTFEDNCRGAAPVHSDEGTVGRISNPSVLHARTDWKSVLQHLPTSPRDHRAHCRGGALRVPFQSCHSWPPADRHLPAKDLPSAASSK